MEFQRRVTCVLVVSLAWLVENVIADAMPPSINLKVTQEMQEVSRQRCNFPATQEIKVLLETSTDLSRTEPGSSSPCTPSQQLVNPPSFFNDTQLEMQESCPWKWTCTFLETRHPQTLWQAVPLKESCLNNNGVCVTNSIRQVVLYWRGCDEVAKEPQWTYNLEEVAVGVSCQELGHDHSAL